MTEVSEVWRGGEEADVVTKDDRTETARGRQVRRTQMEWARRHRGEQSQDIAYSLFKHAGSLTRHSGTSINPGPLSSSNKRMQNMNTPRREEVIRSAEMKWGTVFGGSSQAEMGIVLVALMLAAWLVFGATDLINAVDYQHLHHPYRGYLKALVLSGEWAWWNPYVALGRPFVGDPEAAVFYPPTWLWVIMPERWALWSALALHVAFCGIGARRLVLYWGRGPRIALVVGLAFALSQPYLAPAAGGLIGYVFVMSYWPWWLRWSEQLAERFSSRVFIKLSMAVALAFLGGHPHAFWLNGVVTALYLAGLGTRGTVREAFMRVGRGLLGFGGACAAGLMLAAVQLLPLLELSEQGNRLGMSRMLAGNGYMEVEDMLGFLSPAIFNPGSLWGSCVHVGWAGLLVLPLALARIQEARVRALALVGGACLAISMGPLTPVFDLVYPLLPGFGGFRMVGRFAAYGALALLLLAAFGLPRSSDTGGSKVGLACAWIVWIGGVLWVCSGTTTDSLYLVWISLAIMGCVLCLMRGRPSVGAKHIWGGWLVAEMVLASIVVIQPFSRVHAPGGDEPPAVLKNMELPSGLPPRIWAHQSSIHSNLGMLHGYSNVFGNVALTPRRVWFYLHFVAGVAPSPFQLTYFPDEVQDKDFSVFSGANIAAMIKRDGGLVVNPSPGQRAWLAREVDYASPGVELWEKTVANRYPEVLSVIESAPPSGWPARRTIAATDFVRIDEFAPDRIKMTVNADQPALLVLAEAWYPGWVAYVDDVACEVVPVNTWMRGVWIEGGGERRVVWVYRPTDLYAGVVISALTALLGGLLWVRRCRPGPEGEAPSGAQSR